MNDGQFEQMLERLLQADLSAGAETFREELLARCLAVLDADVRDEPHESDVDCRVVELDDDDLGMLSAAGEAARVEEPPHLDGGGKALA